MALLKPCLDCGEPCTGTRCREHQRQRGRYEQSRQPYRDGYGGSYRTQAKQARARSGGICEGCGTEPAMEVHHKIPLSKGGTNLPENLIHLGWRCHQEAHRHKGRRGR
jgi:5-methylcytosine-specific restriction enzyme A